MPTVEFPRMGTIAQAAAESGVPAYRVRQLCKAGTVRSVQCGRKTLVNLSSLAAWMQRAATAVRYPPGAVMTRKKPPRCWNTETAKKWRKKPASPLHSHFIILKGV